MLSVGIWQYNNTHEITTLIGKVNMMLGIFFQCFSKGRVPFSQFSHSVVSDSLRPHEPQHARPPYPSPTPGVHPNPCPLCRWCHPTNHLILCYPLLLLPPIPPSIRVFSNESDLPIRWPKYGSLSVSPFNEYPGLISVRINWFPCYPRALKNLFQHNSKRWILQCSTFFMVQLSHPYMATGKTIALIIWTSVGKVMSLLFNTLSRFVI